MSSSHAYWVGRCHLSAHSPGAGRWEGEADEAVTVVVVMAASEDEMRTLLLQRLQEEGLELLRLDAVQTLLQCFRREGMSQTLANLADKTTPRIPVVFGEMTPILPEPTLASTSAEPSQEAPPVNYDEIAWSDLFTLNQPPLWAVIDGVNCREAMERLSRADVQSCCLYATTDTATRAIAPWLVRLEPDSEIREWLESLPQDQHWGILLQSRATMKQLRAHLRKFTMLWTPANDQAPVYFRFYDPRVALDMSQALKASKMAHLLAPIEAMVAQLSPQMVVPQDLMLVQPVTIDTGAGDCHGRLVRIALSEQHRLADAQPRRFSIGPEEFQRFGWLQQERSKAAIAVSLRERYPTHRASEILPAVESAVQLGQAYRLVSKKQTTTLAKCFMEFGEAFPAHYPEAKGILENSLIESWRKRDLLEEWLPRGRVRRALLAPYQGDNGTQEDNFRPIADKEMP